MKTYRLGSSEMINTPGMIRWAINGAHFPKDRPLMVKMVAESWGIPRAAARALVTKKVPYTIEGDVVVFSVPEKEGRVMGYAIATSACFGCGRLFSYNPMRVPSITRDPKVGREPVCLACITAANPARERNGLPPIVPHPDAYSPCDEEELS